MNWYYGTKTRTNGINNLVVCGGAAVIRPEIGNLIHFYKVGKLSKEIFLSDLEARLRNEKMTKEETNQVLDLYIDLHKG